MGQEVGNKTRSGCQQICEATLYQDTGSCLYVPYHGRPPIPRGCHPGNWQPHYPELKANNLINIPIGIKSAWLKNLKYRAKQSIRFQHCDPFNHLNNSGIPQLHWSMPGKTNWSNTTASTSTKWAVRKAKSWVVGKQPNCLPPYLIWKVVIESPTIRLRYL